MMKQIKLLIDISIQIISLLQQHQEIVMRKEMNQTQFKSQSFLLYPKSKRDLCCNIKMRLSSSINGLIIRDGSPSDLFSRTIQNFKEGCFYKANQYRNLENQEKNYKLTIVLLDLKDQQTSNQKVKQFSIHIKKQNLEQGLGYFFIFKHRFLQDQNDLIK
ncbi:unnamed protein product (macronuclear) [Paramecium tetraurelia]|uniref:Uncharacterized protein n=1 Tax=Paramecium tetraurelia TaxID=5888 RepID=A0BRI1_PARTE|nr:uncharacterized protein GSPATT00031379001 [Paramecium tetraurelia]CAK61148.1 unnamed protein product [Paramecium tetraurelia]|eukprot:XP_001428546.1 hypothetical protein (macronuclear) [Paramecium tetraurelia strain d4-2]